MSNEKSRRNWRSIIMRCVMMIIGALIYTIGLDLFLVPNNIIDGGVVETTFRPTETFEQAHIERKKMQYLYNDGEFYNYMDNETFEQIMISAEDAADSMKFVKENEEVTISFYQGNAFAIDPPLSVELVVTETEPGVKGNTATGATKPAIVETGAQVMVPLFVNEGEVIKIDTRSGEYLSRA